MQGCGARLARLQRHETYLQVLTSTRAARLPRRIAHVLRRRLDRSAFVLNCRGVVACRCAALTRCLCQRIMRRARTIAGKPFMPAAERVKIVSALRCVDEAFVAIDEDRTCCKSIECITPPPDYFCNGGDQVRAQDKTYAPCTGFAASL